MPELLASQAVFALHHIPDRLAFDGWPHAGTAAADLALLFVSGLFFSGVFLRPRNLLVAVGIHALGNVPALLFAAPSWLHPSVMFVATAALLLFGPRWQRAVMPG